MLLYFTLTNNFRGIFPESPQRLWVDRPFSGANDRKEESYGKASAHGGYCRESVSKGLAGKDGVSEEMREKILETAKEMGYLPPAKSTAAQRSINIGILVADRHFGDNTFYANLYRSLVSHCNRLKYQCMLEIVMPHAEDGCVLPLILAGGSVDALVFMGEFHRSYLAAMLKNNLPFVLLDFYDDVIAGDSVQSDNVSGSFQITEHLLQTGCRKIAFVGSVRATSCRPASSPGPTGGWRTATPTAAGSPCVCPKRCRTALCATATR